MDYGTIIMIIGLLSQALGLSLMILTGSVLLYLIIRGFCALCYWLHLRRIGKIYKQIDEESQAQMYEKLKQARDATVRSSDGKKMFPGYYKSHTVTPESLEQTRAKMREALRDLTYREPPTNREELHAEINRVAERTVKNSPIATSTGPHRSHNAILRKLYEEE